MKRQLQDGKTASGIRLAIAVPALLVLVILLFGHVCSVLLGSIAAGDESSIPVERLQRVLEQIGTWIWLTSGLGAVVGFAIARMTTGPIRAMVREFQKLETEGKAAALDENVGNEFGQLYAAFNRMVDSLGEHMPERWRHIFHSVATGILTVDSHGTLTNINSAADKVLELGGVGIRSRSCREFFEKFGDMSELVALLRAGWEGGEAVTGCEILVQTVSGESKTLLISTSVSETRPGGGHDVVATLMDLGRLEDVNAKVNHESRLSAVGVLASGIAHEIRNPMAAMRGMAQLLMEGPCKGNPEAEKYTRVILDETTRLSNMLNQLLSFARPSEDRREPVSIEELIRRAMALTTGRASSKGIRIELETDGFSPSCLVIPEKIVQVFLNLLINAVQAVPEGGFIRVYQRLVTEGVQVTVHNTGSYIPPDAQAHIFQPFFTTKAGGTGLGLAVSYQIVASHRGTLVVESHPETGTAFHCTLPILGTADPKNKGEKQKMGV